LFSAVLLLKFLLMLLSFLMLSLIVLAVPNLRADWRVYYLAFGHVVGMWLFPLWQAICPHIGRLASQSKQAATSFTSKVAKIVSVVTLLMSVGLFVGAPAIARVVLGEQSGAGVPVIRILSPLPFIIVVLPATPLRHVGVALASLATEVFVNAAMCLALRRNSLHVFGALDKGVDNQKTVA